MKTLLPEINSADKRFHAGNPATGEQGTRVTDTWLNDVQDRVRDVQAEAHYVLEKAGFKPLENKQTQLYEAIVKIIDDNRKTASLTQKGETKLYTGYDSQSEDLALTPKTGYQLKQLIDSNTRALGNVIPNSKKSSAVNSNSAETVATSAAVKTAYDKGVNAEKAADDANNNANGRVPKTGDTTINGILRAKNTSGGWSAYQFETSEGYWQLEVHPNSHEAANRRFNMLFNPNIGNRVYLSFPALGDDGEVVAYQSFAVNKAGDTMRGILRTVGIASTHFGHGDYASQYTSGAPFMVESTGSKDRDTYHPFVKGLVRSKGRYGAGFSLGYTTKQGNGDGFGRGIINLIEDNGTSKNWGFEHNGDFYSAGDVLTARGKSLNNATQLSDFSYQKISDIEVRKYPDGTMIQTCRKHMLTGDYSKVNFNWAVAFVEMPILTATAQYYNSVGDHDTIITFVQGTSNSACHLVCGETYNNSGEIAYVNIIAVGRWKR